jgi:hypothetical protein
MTTLFNMGDAAGALSEPKRPALAVSTSDRLRLGTRARMIRQPVAAHHFGSVPVEP